MRSRSRELADELAARGFVMRHDPRAEDGAPRADWTGSPADSRRRGSPGARVEVPGGRIPGEGPAVLRSMPASGGFTSTVMGTARSASGQVVPNAFQ
jgi:hypothetical protein